MKKLLRINSLYAVSSRMARALLALILVAGAVLFAGQAQAAFLPSTGLSFGNVPVGSTSPALTLTFQNTSTFARITITSISASPPFSTPTNTCPVPLLPGGICTISVQFSPVVVGTGQTGTLTVIHTGSTTFPVTETASLVGNGIATAPIITSLAPPGGTVGTLYSHTFTASGTTPITWSLVTGTLPTGLTLNAASGALSGTPTTVGLFTFTVQAANGTPPNAQQTNTVQINPPVVLVTVTPPNLLFNNVTVGSTSAPQAVTVMNGGKLPISVSVTPPTGPFSFSNACSPSLGSGLSCVISVQFAPIVVGAGQSGVLSVVTTDIQNSNATFSVSLSGNGIAVPAPNASLVPAALDFGTQPVGTTSVAQSLILSNSGNAALSVASVTMSGAFSQLPATVPAVTIPSCAMAPFTLAQGASCFFDVVFSPTAAGSATGSLFVSIGNAPSVSATLAGVGGAGKLIQVSPTTFIFASQVLNVASAPQAFTVTNVGTQVVNITSLLASSGATDFIVTHNCGTLNTLASVSATGSGNSCSGTVTFQPSAIGARSGIVSVVSDAQGSPHMLTLSGGGLIQPFALLTTSASSLGFGQRGIANRSATQIIRVTNSGNVPVDISSIYTSGDFYQSHNCPGSLDSAQSCEVSAWFLPSIPGARAGELVIVNSGQDNPNRVAFQGTGCRFFTIPGSRLAQVNCKR